MKLLFLSKRRPQGKDLLERPFGRFYYLPKVLAAKGHEVYVLLCSYKKDPSVSLQKDGIHWTSVSLVKHGPLAYVREAEKIIRQVGPEWIIGFSDTYYGMLAEHLGKKHNLRSLIDAYDNYESYIPWLKPLHALWRRALARATLVTVAGPGLAHLLGRSRPEKSAAVLPMAADPPFRPLAKAECRQMLGLSLDRKLIGYSGSTIHSSRGPEILFQAFESLKRDIPDVELVMSGRKGRNVSIPAGVNWLGYLPDDQMPLLMNSLDVLTVLNRPSAFGNYSYPVKLYEAMACGVPTVVSETLSTKWIMRGKPDLLVPPGDAEKLGSRIKEVLEMKNIDYVDQPGWEAIGADLEGLLQKEY